MSQGRPPRPFSDLHLWEIRSIRDVIAVVVVALLFWLGYAMRDVTIPLLVALLLAYLFEPAIAWMARARWIPFGRAGAVSVLLLGITLVLLAGLALLVPRVISQAADIVHDVQSGLVRARLSKVVETYVPEEYRVDASHLLAVLPSGDEPNQPADLDGSSAKPPVDPSERVADAAVAIGQAKDMAAQSPVDLLGLASTTGRVAWIVIGQAIAVGMLAFLIPFYFFFFSLWYPQVVSYGQGLLPETHRATIERLLSRMDYAVAGFVRGRIVIAIIMAVLYAIGWAICGVPYAILLAIVIGAFGLVPFLGVVGIPIAVGMLALAELDLPEAERMAWWAIILWPTLVFAIVNALDGWVLTPLIAGKATNLDPVTIFVAVLAGGSVMGAYGMLIAIPIAACLKILLSDLVVPKLREMGQRPKARDATDASAV